MKIGDAATFVDAMGEKHAAIVTAVWGTEGSESPSVNLVLVSTDEAKTDTYGRQIERHTSVVHEKNRFAHGMFWR